VKEESMKRYLYACIFFVGATASLFSMEKVPEIIKRHKEKMIEIDKGMLINLNRVLLMVDDSDLAGLELVLSITQSKEAKRKIISLIFENRKPDIMDPSVKMFLEIKQLPSPYLGKPNE
jgi:hypothetical protein